MQLRDFDFILPQELIAQHPAVPRDAARLLVYNRREDSIQHAQVKDLASFLPAKSLLVANNSKVRAARLHAHPLGKEQEIEVVILEAVQGALYRCLIGGKVKLGMQLSFFHQGRSIPLSAEVSLVEPDSAMTTYQLHFNHEGAALEKMFSHYGEMPLPPYIQERSSTPEQYQTVYAQHLGSAAAPTAGLHFTPSLISSLQQQGFEWAEVTLHVGMGTFLPLRQESIEANHLHTEHAHISVQTAQQLNIVKKERRPIVAIGTTSTRTLESHTANSTITPGWSDTNLFIYPGYLFQSVDILLTNFHLPKSSLLLLVSAFLGNAPQSQTLHLEPAEMIKRLHRLYAEAIKERYRFFSFGDAMLIL